MIITGFIKTCQFVQKLLGEAQKWIKTRHTHTHKNRYDGILKLHGSTIKTYKWQIWCDFDRASSLICGNKMPTRCNRGFYCRSYCLLNMFRAPLCPASGAQEYWTVVAACGISCCGFQVAGLVWSWGLCVWTHNPQLHTRPTTWKPQLRFTCPDT